MRFLSPILWACAVSLSAPVLADPASTEEADIAAIRAVGKRWADDYAAGRFAEIPELYTVDTMVMPRGRPRIEGREAMRRAVGGMAAGRKVAIAVTEREIHAFGDYGWYVGDFRVTYTPQAAGAPPVDEAGRSFILYRRDSDGHWRIHRDIDSPAPATALTPSVAVAAPRDPETAAAAYETPARWDPQSRTEAVACDRLSASHYDRTRLAPGVARADIDVPQAIAVCEADLARLPGDPRLLFQLGRLYGYAGDKGRTLAFRRAAAAAGNDNAIFLLGYLDFAVATDDAARCAAARRMKLAADRGNYSARITYPSYVIEGKLAACPNRGSIPEFRAYLAAARPSVEGFFETRFAEHLASQLAAADGDETRKRLASQMSGVWKGSFRRYDADGSLVETVPSEVRIAFDEGGDDYRQTNITRRADGGEDRIDTTGRWDGDRLRFSNARVEGWFGPLEGDTTGLASVLQMTFKGEQPMTMSELLTVSPDGRRRMRVAQYIRGGRIVRRTLIDEIRSAP